MRFANPLSGDFPQGPDLGGHIQSRLGPWEVLVLLVRSGEPTCCLKLRQVQSLQCRSPWLAVAGYSAGKLLRKGAWPQMVLREERPMQCQK